MSGFAATVTELHPDGTPGRYAHVGAVFTSVEAALVACEKSAAKARLRMGQWEASGGAHRCVSDCGRFCYTVVRHT